MKRLAVNMGVCLLVAVGGVLWNWDCLTVPKSLAVLCGGAVAGLVTQVFGAVQASFVHLIDKGFFDD